MRLKHIVTGTLAVTHLILAGCGEGGGASQKVAEQFIDRYYVQANPAEATALATDDMAQKIEEQFALLAKVVPVKNSGSHKASFTMKESSTRSWTRPQLGYAHYIYEVEIAAKGAEPVYKSVVLAVKHIDGAWRITGFDEKSESGPSQVVR
ncbi:hypothetical protein MELA_01921 [Candidatus Methylomirabilis lanthanidiphila]|uniref:DUF4829 domain-containing protein n=1 Tax=Candidatus Methylomirabilis lanthanidiphila TaxID=2211376 RepID=A0A564ZK82_9BACT|nr:hypothetical protein MELA_01921 [Candidatus Methylomirabilis lanthanidiphila]